MKNTIKIGLLLLVAVISITVVTATDNKDLPSQDEITQFITEMKGSSASDIFEKVKSDHPTWNADLLKCPSCAGDKEAIALYWTASTEKGYGSTYCNETGVISPSTLEGYTLKESYKGTLEESETNTTENTSTPTSEDVVEVNSSEHTYNDLKEFLDDYEGNTKYSQTNIQSLQDTFLKAGWGTEIRYCIAVNTTDEGLLHIVLGA